MFFKKIFARLEIRARVEKNLGLGFEKKMIGYGKLPGCLGRVCPVIARFLAGGQMMMMMMMMMIYLCDT